MPMWERTPGGEAGPGGGDSPSADAHQQLRQVQARHKRVARLGEARIGCST